MASFAADKRYTVRDVDYEKISADRQRGVR